MSGDASQWIHDYLDGELSDEDARQLSAWIQESPEHGREFARAAMLHDRLQHELVALDDVEEMLAPAIAPGCDITRASSPASEPSPRSRRTYLLMAVAAVFLLAGSLYFSRDFFTGESGGPQIAGTDKSNDKSFAMITQMVDVRWSGTSEMSRGDRLANQVIALETGVLNLLFDDGVAVTLQGPARYELLTPTQTRLHAGILSATVPPGAEGFRVDTPSAEVTDLGTAFGIKLVADGASEVTVFDGKVDVAPHDSDVTRLLSEGEAVRVVTGERMESLDFDAKPYEKLWPISSGIVGSTGAFKFAPAWPRKMRFARSDTEIFVLPEGYRHRLKSPLGVNIAQPGTYTNVDHLTPSILSAEQAIRSFLLKFHPVNPGRGSRIEGSITFDRPVLGIILLQKELTASKKVFSPRSSREVIEPRQLELTDRPGGDSVTLSDDRRTVSLSLAVPRRFADLVRVILDDSRRSRAGRNIE